MRDAVSIWEATRQVERASRRSVRPSRFSLSTSTKMDGMGLSRNELIASLVKMSLVMTFGYFALRYTIDAIDPTKKQKKEAQEKATRLLRRIGISNQSVDLNEYELSIAAQLVDPQSIEICWDDIAGLDDVIRQIRGVVIRPLKSPCPTVESDLIEPPKGVLLYGPPGCGKTMIAKATAKEANARFINLEIHDLTDKWYGESQKLAAAVFTLAVKLQPCIIFVDEIDSFLRQRSLQDHEATAMMKTQFMRLWDGISSAKHCQVVVMGATNRPQDVDKAILRRMPSQIQIKLPKLDNRVDIIRRILRNTEKKDADIDINHIAFMTEGFSGSDLRELCRIAAMIRVMEKEDDLEAGYNELRNISNKDFIEALERMKESKKSVNRFMFTEETLD